VVGLSGDLPLAAATQHNLEAHVRVRSSASARLTEVRSIADPEAAKDLAALRKKIARSPAAAKAYLQEVGILTPGGNLTRRYGGR